MKEDEKKEDHEMMKERDERWKANVVIPLFTIKIIFFLSSCSSFSFKNHFNS